MVRRLRSTVLAAWPPLPVRQRLNAAVLWVAAYTVGVYAVLKYAHLDPPDWGGFSAALNTLVLGVLLQFRNRESYDRWWEGRRLWGQLVNDSRNFCLKVRHLPGLSTDERGRLGRLLGAFPVALRNHLRGVGTVRDVPGFEESHAAPKHVPLFVAAEVFAVLQAWRRNGRITDFDLLMLDPHARGLMDVCGACERIKSTPVPLSYRALLRHGLTLYLLSTPWLLAKNLAWGAAPIMALTAYFLVGVELTAADVEEPFGRDADDLALTRFCDTIRASTAEILGLGLAPAPSSIEMRVDGAVTGPRSGQRV